MWVCVLWKIVNAREDNDDKKCLRMNLEFTLRNGKREKERGGGSNSFCSHAVLKHGCLKEGKAVCFCFLSRQGSGGGRGCEQQSDAEEL